MNIPLFKSPSRFSPAEIFSKQRSCVLQQASVLSKSPRSSPFGDTLPSPHQYVPKIYIINLFILKKILNNITYLEILP